MFLRNEGVGEGDVDGLGVDRADEFIEAVQPGQQVGLAAQDGRVEEVCGQGRTQWGRAGGRVGEEAAEGGEQ